MTNNEYTDICFSRAAHLTPSDHDVLLKLASINYFALYEPQGAISHVKQCLHYDPEQKECKTAFRKLKKLDKAINGAVADMEQNKLVAAAKKLVGSGDSQGVIATVEEEVTKLEHTLGATGKIPRRLNTKLYSMACKIYGQVWYLRDRMLKKKVMP
jgi:DnaJ family protein C protein 3